MKRALLFLAAGFSACRSSDLSPGVGTGTWSPGAINNQMKSEIKAELKAELVAELGTIQPSAAAPVAEEEEEEDQFGC